MRSARRKSSWYISLIASEGSFWLWCVIIFLVSKEPGDEVTRIAISFEDMTSKDAHVITDKNLLITWYPTPRTRSRTPRHSANIVISRAVRGARRTQEHRNHRKARPRGRGSYYTTSERETGDQQTGDVVVAVVAQKRKTKRTRSTFKKWKKGANNISPVSTSHDSKNGMPMEKKKQKCYYY